jgi:hypothetical protein
LESQRLEIEKKIGEDMNKFIFFLWLAIAGYTQAHADWNPEYLHANIDQAPLMDSKFKKRKSKVLRYLTNSWCSAEKATLLMDLVVLQRPNICVEVGVYSGSTLLPIATGLTHNKQGTVFAIDAWSNDVACQYLSDDDPNKSSWKYANLHEIYRSFTAMTKQWNIDSVCNIIRSTSKKAAVFVESIDLLHIDGGYSEEISYEDVKLYLPKVKKGGYILYSNIGWTVNGRMPRMKAFQLLLDSCEIIAMIDERSSFLLRKLID